MLLSLIIPIYNVEKYIAECIQSILYQLTEEVEVIVVNDGTLDNSLCILNELIGNIPEILRKSFIIIDQKNQGQSIARNNAIDIAQGEFIGFIDSDDYVDSSYINKIINELKENPDIDVLSFCGRAFSDNRFLNKVINERINSGKFHNDYEFIFQNFDNCEWMCWTRVIRRELLIENKFPKGYILEDMFVFVNLYLLDIRIKHIEDVLYFYRQHPQSATNKKDLNYYKSFEFLIRYYSDKITKLNKEESKTLVSIAKQKVVKSYLYELAFNSNAFFGLNRILKQSNKLNLNSYVVFIYYYARIRLKNFLYVLGMLK